METQEGGGKSSLGDYFISHSYSWWAFTMMNRYTKKQTNKQKPYRSHMGTIGCPRAAVSSRELVLVHGVDLWSPHGSAHLSPVSTHRWCLTISPGQDRPIPKMLVTPPHPMQCCQGQQKTASPFSLLPFCSPFLEGLEVKVTPKIHGDAK